MVDVNAVISIVVAARMLGLSRGRLDQLIADGHIKRNADGKLTIKSVAQDYAAFLRENAKRMSKSNASQAYLEARTDLARLKFKQQSRALIPWTEAEAIVQILIAQGILAFDTLPARIARIYEDRQKIEAVCDEVRVELSGALDREWLKWYAETRDDQRRRKAAGEHVDPEEDIDGED